MSISITYNDDGETKIIENGEVKDDIQLQWDENSIDESVLNNINKSPKILSGERIGLEDSEEEEDQEGVPEFNVEIEINGSNFITNENQKVLLNPLVNNIDSGDIVDDREYTVSWYLNDSLLDVSNIFELNTEQLEDERNNIIKLEVLINDRILVDKTSILKYLDFESNGGNGGGSGGNGDGNGGGNGGSGGNGGNDDENNQRAEGKVIHSDEGIKIVGSSFRVGDPITFIATGNGNDGAIWSFGDGDGTTGIHVEHVYTSEGVYNIGARVLKDFEVYSPEAKIKIVSRDGQSSNGSDNNGSNRNRGEYGGGGGQGRSGRGRGNNTVGRDTNIRMR